MERKNLINLASLTTIQLSNAVLPLVIFPFTLNVIGSYPYSRVVLSEALALLVLPFILYSFEIDGVSKIVGLDIRADIKEISKVFSEVFFLRMFIFVMCLIAILLLSPLLEKDILVLVYCWMLIPLSHIFQSFWLFQGLELNAPVALFNLVSRLVCVGLVVWFVRNPSDYQLVPIIIGLCYLFGGITSLAYAFIKFKLRLRFFHFSEYKSSLISGKEIFLGNMSVVLYRDTNVLILGFLGCEAKAIAAYSIAEKLIKSFQATMRPLNQLFFPKVIRLTKETSEPNKSIFKNIFQLTLPQIIAFIVLGVLLIASFNIVEDHIKFFREFPNKKDVILLFIIMFPAILFGVANFMFGTAGLNYLNRRNYYFISILVVGIVSIIFCLILVFVFGVIGASASFLFSEMFLFAMIVRLYLSKQHNAVVDQ